MNECKCLVPKCSNETGSTTIVCTEHWRKADCEHVSGYLYRWTQLRRKIENHCDMDDIELAFYHFGKACHRLISGLVDADHPTEKGKI